METLVRAIFAGGLVTAITLVVGFWCNAFTACMAGFIADKFNRNRISWFFLTLIYGVLTLSLLVLSGRKKEGEFDGAQCTMWMVTVMFFLVITIFIAS